MSADDLIIGGVEPFSTVDWPGKLAATVFLQGCPWRCTYCHNPALQDPRAAPVIAWSSVRGHLEARRGRLDGVVFSGGEPTRQAPLVEAMDEVREMGMGVGLHSAGCYPARLAAVLAHVDLLALLAGAAGDQQESTGRHRQNPCRWTHGAFARGGITMLAVAAGGEKE